MVTPVYQRKREENSLSLGRTVMLTPGSLSLMKGGFPVFRSSSRISRTFLAQTFPWTRFFSSCGIEGRGQSGGEETGQSRGDGTVRSRGASHQLTKHSQTSCRHWWTGAVCSLFLRWECIIIHRVPLSMSSHVCSTGWVQPYQEVHGPGKLLGHLKLPQDVDWVFVLLQVCVQGAKLHILLHHDICKS